MSVAQSTNMPRGRPGHVVHLSLYVSPIPLFSTRACMSLLSGLNRAKTPPLLIAIVIVLQLRMAWTSRAKRFAVREGEIYSALAAFNRWDEIDDSEEWQRRIYYALSLSYALVSLVALVRTFLIFFRFLAFSMYLEST